METSDVVTRDTFTYIWTIENFSELTYIDLESPSFVVKSMGDTVWQLNISEYAGFFCHIRTNSFSTKVSDGIDFEFSFLGADGSPLISKTSSEPRLFLNLMDRAAFLERWAEFIPNNTLTVQCRMWKRERKIPTDVCYARTRLKTYTGSFIWAIEEFSSLPSSAAEDLRTLPSDERKVYPLKPLTQKGPFMALILYLKRNSESEDVCVEFLIEKPRNYAYTCEISILDANGKVIVSKVDRGRTHYGCAWLTCWPLISKNKLIANKNLFLPNDTLVLRCSFEACTGVISNELEYFTPNVSSVAEEEEEVLDFHVAAAEADDLLEFEEYFVK
ncbi:hypothetical protein AVEN_118619-1 [Araneus ventricosus]|uniref:MATH domain-containing protein n=1 Tax=Araneus ventricosus TaxID=182803 RepID=A0A4Y2AVY1_ARAVE|nr:hypothetical protein AVEN_118619-1 [Araneus ventricosus]